MTPSHTQRLPPLPRPVAAGVAVGALARTVWAVGVMVLLLCLPAVLGLPAQAGKQVDVAPPVIALAAMIVAMAALLWRPSHLSQVVYLVVGTLGVYFYQYCLLADTPALQQDALYVLNRPTLALVLLGTVSASPISAILWGVTGFGAGLLSTALVSFQLGLPLLTGAGPTLALINYCLAFGGIAIIHRFQRDRLPDVATLQRDAGRQEQRRAVERRADALIHDTVLNDLALVSSAPDRLDNRARQRLRRDLETFAGTPTGTAVQAPAHPADPRFYTSLMERARDYQRRGLSVGVSIDTSARTALSADASAAALGAVGACLDNVLRHSGVHSAELILGGDSEQVTVMVVDAGTGFDPAAVPADRLGLRISVLHRVEIAGGSVKVFSTVGAGTSVIISFPARGWDA